MEALHNEKVIPLTYSETIHLFGFYIKTTITPGRRRPPKGAALEVGGFGTLLVF